MLYLLSKDPSGTESMDCLSARPWSGWRLEICPFYFTKGPSPEASQKKRRNQRADMRATSSIGDARAILGVDAEFFGGTILCYYSPVNLGKC